MGNGQAFRAVDGGVNPSGGRFRDYHGTPKIDRSVEWYGSGIFCRGWLIRAASDGQRMRRA